MYFCNKLCNRLNWFLKKPVCERSIIDLKFNSFYATGVYVFDRKFKKLQKDNAASRNDSREHDNLKEEIAGRLCDRLKDILNKPFTTAVDLGCNAGNLLKFLDKNGSIETLYQTDISEKMLYRDQELDKNYKLKPKRIILDEDCVELPFEESSIDLVISSMSMHWVNNLPRLLENVKKILKEDGVFIGAMLGGDTLRELRTAFLLAEQEVEKGVSARVSPYVGVPDVGNLLTKSKFALPTVDAEHIEIKYQDMRSLMKHLQGMGEANANINRRTFLSRKTLGRANQIYHQYYSNDDKTVSATFQVIYFIAWKPSKSQPKPLKRGSAEFSLSDLGETVSLN